MRSTSQGESDPSVFKDGNPQDWQEQKHQLVVTRNLVSSTSTQCTSSLKMARRKKQSGVIISLFNLRESPEQLDTALLHKGVEKSIVRVVYICDIPSTDHVHTGILMVSSASLVLFFSTQASTVLSYPKVYILECSSTFFRQAQGAHKKAPSRPGPP